MTCSNTYALILENNSDLSGELARLFDDAGFEVREEGHSGHGVIRVLEREPAVILMAEEMPSMDGVEVLPLIRRLTSAPIIVMSQGGDVPVANALLQGADMCMSRPLNFRELLTRVRALVRRSEANRGGTDRFPGFDLG